jgi:hypothetical protein
VECRIEVAGWSRGARKRRVRIDGDDRLGVGSVMTSEKQRREHHRQPSSVWHLHHVARWPQHGLLSHSNIHGKAYFSWLILQTCYVNLTLTSTGHGGTRLDSSRDLVLETRIGPQVHLRVSIRSQRLQRFPERYAVLGGREDTDTCGSSGFSPRSTQHRDEASEAFSSVSHASVL